MVGDARHMVNFFHVFQILPGFRLNSFLCHTKKMQYTCNIVCVPTNLDIWMTHNFSALFLAHLSRRLRGELIVYRSSRRPLVRASVSPSVHTFKHKYLCNQLADQNEILSEASFGWGKGFSWF